MNLFRHIGIVVQDMQKALFFYKDLLGFEVTKDMNESGNYIDKFSKLDNVVVRTVKLKDPSGNLIELLKYASHPKNNCPHEITDIGISHFALTVDDVEGLYEQLSKQGVTFNCYPQVTPDQYAKVTFCKDFEGNLIELVEVL